MEKITVTLTLEPTAKKMALLAALCGDDLSPILEETASVKPEPDAETPSRPKAETKVVDLPWQAETKAYSAVDVKAVCLKLSKEGRQADLKAAFAKFDAKKLSEVKPEDYPALMKELGHE